MNLSTFQFANLELAPLLWVWLAFTVVLIALERRSEVALDQFVGTALQDALVTRPADWRRWLRIGFLSAAALFLVLALMRPQWGLRFIATPRVGAEIMVALDVSRSMLADDARPSRLERAKAEINDLLGYLEQDHVGLIAFAGRASVLSPMTPDRSFLRLVLDGVGPHSVSRGGTRLAEPIQRAIAGMGEAGPAQRALILITDGEDHDSFALDAAREAADAGIKIIAIGFGDEGGSQIYITDPRSGARSLLRDGDGDPVISRLGGDLLREIALATDGAYIPAGTGVLDLESIYDEHIAGLTRSQLDARGRSIRDEVYGAFVLVAILCVVASSLASGRGAARSRRAAMLLACLISQSLMDTPAQADEPAPGQRPAEAEASTVTENASGGAARDATTETPREKFNRASDQLEDPGTDSLLADARREATDDSALRYAATYNLGLAAVARAEAIEPTEPTQALEALYQAADWFRDATRQRPASEDARHNLDVTLRKALILADFVAKQQQRDLTTELDELLALQRTQVGVAAGLLEQVSQIGELEAADQLRPAFAGAATEQRTLIADVADLGDRAAEERDAIAGMTEQERSPEDAMRGAQLEAVLHYLDAGLERMGQARRQLRKRSAERAYRRSAGALAQLTRARDQFRDPVEQIQVLHGELQGLAQASAALGAAGSVLPGAEAPVRLPAFLTAESAGADNEAVRSRTQELGARLKAGIAAAAQQEAPPSAEQQQLMAAVAEAVPFITAASDGLERAGSALEETDYPQALQTQLKAADALGEARERFFDLRQLLEASYADQTRIADVAGIDEEGLDGPREEYTQALRSLQDRNLARGERLETKILAAIQGLDDAIAAAAVDAQQDPSALQKAQEDTAQERERLGIASQLLTGATAAMDDTRDALSVDGGNPRWESAAASAQAAARQLELMRTLFFSIVEHVRELARLQVELNDPTQDAVALSAAEQPASASVDTSGGDPPDALPRGSETLARTRQLSPEQGELAERAGTIGDALAAQAESVAAAPPEQAGPDPEESARRFRLAGEHVVASQLAMREAAEILAAETAPLQPVLEHQTAAVEELAKALALLTPPEQQEQEQQQQEQEEQQQQQQQAGGEAQEEPQPEQEVDPSQLLQGVRDREAERRREREREASRYEPVDKDW